MPQEQEPKVTIHADNLDKDGIKRVISINSRSINYIQCYADNAYINASGDGVGVYIVYPAETMDAICEEWLRFRRELAAHEANKES